MSKDELSHVDRRGGGPSTRRPLDPALSESSRASFAVRALASRADLTVKRPMRKASADYARQSSLAAKSVSRWATTSESLAVCASSTAKARMWPITSGGSFPAMDWVGVAIEIPKTSDLDEAKRACRQNPGLLLPPTLPDLLRILFVTSH